MGGKKESFSLVFRITRNIITSSICLFY